MQESPNMIVRSAAAIQALEKWAADYQKRYAVESASGPVIPKAQIGAIRGGDSTGIGGCPEVCRIYLGAFTVPGQNPLELRDEIEEVLRAAGVPPTEVEIYHFRRGYEAQNAERIKESLLRAHNATFGAPPPRPNPATCSMWRDVNIFNEVGIPAITYGPRSESHSERRSFKTESLYQAACVYARLIVDLCNQEKPRRQR
jgi:acetylornithine deacetylase/succinyl-diaminopimelate desuccinylase-like protein